MENKISTLVSAVIDKYNSHQLKSAFTVAVSGIDAAGKGYISRLLQDELRERRYHVALINIDPWQNPIAVRLKKENAAENVYENMFRWNDLFEQLVFPLQKNRAIHLETKGISTDGDIYYPLLYDFRDIDIVLVEGILLLKQQYLSYFDYKIWIDCSFETGMQRAIQRNAEKLGEEALQHDYHTFYYPAQYYHFKKDDPAGNADLVFDNNGYHAATHT
jgi:uridine kinase